MNALDGVVMELLDCAFPTLSKVVATATPEVAFQGVDYALLVGMLPRLLLEFHSTISMDSL